jgi:hypothetical protein
MYFYHGGIMSDIVVVDYRNICKICSFSILSGQIACQYATEPEEIANRIAKRLFCIRAEHPEASIILAVDTPPYWRHSYILNWYNDRGIEPQGYKANRSGQAWPFATDRESMDLLFASVKEQIAAALELIVIGDMGLEADDIWGIIASTEKTSTVRGISTDSDWRQLCGKNITVHNPTTNEIYTEPEDIRPKFIAGDRGDNISGCNKRKKDGTPGTTMWGIDGATKLLTMGTEDEWMAKIDKETFERNKHLITLPCPSWDLEEVSTALETVTIMPPTISDEDTIKILDSYGITTPVRSMLCDKAERDLWISKLRAHLQSINKGLSSDD